jgi:anti-anti-sigma factor
MTPIGSSSFALPDRSLLGREGPEAGPSVVWLRGEHDLSTDYALCLTLARAIALDSVGLVVDLSEVDFMAASTVGVIVRARDFLRQRSRSLTVRAPSAAARRVIDACDLSDLLGPSPEMTSSELGKALGSWVAVPPTRRVDGDAASSDPVPERVPARVGRALDLRARAVSTEGLAHSG